MIIDIPSLKALIVVLNTLPPLIAFVLVSMGVVA